jgi:hypothetical protein
VIKIVDGSTPYPTLFRLDCALDNKTIIDLKKIQMVFEVEDLKVTVPLDPTKGRIYVEPTKRKELDTLYNMTAQMYDYVNLITEGILSWRSISSCASDSKEALKNWQQILHEVSTRKCARITYALQWIGIEICETTSYDVLINVVSFIREFELKISDQYRLLDLDVAPKENPTRWWAMHKDGIRDW